MKTMMKLVLSTSEGLPAKVTTALFNRLSEYLGGRMADLFQGVPREDVERSWSAALAGFTREELTRGVAACSERIVAPTVGEFKRLCRPSLDPEFAWYEAQDGLQARGRGEHGVWTHPAVWRAATQMSHELRTSTYNASRVRWQRTLSREFERGWGDDVPPLPAARIEHSPTLKAPTSEQLKTLASLRRTGAGVYKR